MSFKGLSPVGYREYISGDDFKLVDWKIYARMEKLYIKEHEEERSLLVQFLLDSSGSMAYDGKFSYVSRIAAGFAYLATLEIEKFSISLFCKSFYPCETKSDRKHLIQLIDDLNRLIPRGQANLKKLSDQFDAVVRSTSFVIVISDFLDDPDNIISSIYKLSKHDLIVIQLLAPEEEELDFHGDIKFVDIETRRPFITRIMESERIDYRKRLDEHISKIAMACNSVGADFFSFRTNKPIFDAFSEMVSEAVVWRI
jgi:uncharacterized protein (DUF58 family)